VVRLVTAAPPGWDPQMTFVPKTPYMPINEMIAASDLRRFHQEVETARRCEWG
jgi:hypothetical protein